MVQVCRRGEEEIRERRMNECLGSSRGGLGAGDRVAAARVALAEAQVSDGELFGSAVLQQARGIDEGAHHLLLDDVHHGDLAVVGDALVAGQVFADGSDKGLDPQTQSVVLALHVADLARGNGSALEATGLLEREFICAGLFRDGNGGLGSGSSLDFSGGSGHVDVV